MMTKNHHFFILPVSPWPILCTILSFNLLFSLGIFMKFSQINSFFLSLIMISSTSFFWWIFYSNEMNLEGKNCLSFEVGVKLGMILFISSEVFFFFSFFWSYFHYFLSPTLEIGIAWPPVNLLMFEFLNVPLINTLILLSSGFTVTLSHYFLIENKKKMFMLFLMLTVILGSIFTILQVLEYNSSFFSINDSSFGTSFFMLTGFHGIHVLIGSLFLLISLLRSIKMSMSSKTYLSFEMASWYWHFVDVVWIFLYFFLYYLNN